MTTFGTKKVSCISISSVLKRPVHIDCNLHWLGIANFYSASLPLRFNLRGAGYFREITNGYLSAYFTNPSIHISNVEAQKRFWNSWYAEDIPYTRGMAYFLKTDYNLALAAKSMKSNIIRPLDNIVADLAVRRLKGEKVLAKDWLEHLYPYLGKERAEKDFRDMSDGKVIDLSEVEVLGDVGKLVETRQEIMEFGFERRSLDTRRITGLKKGSRAAFAGLREGDKIIWNTRASACKETFEVNMQLVIECGGKEFRVEYWPRSFELVPAWQLTSKH